MNTCKEVLLNDEKQRLCSNQEVVFPSIVVFCYFLTLPILVEIVLGSIINSTIFSGYSIMKVINLLSK